MSIVEQNVIYVFIDAANLWQAQKAKGRFLDYEKIIMHIKKRFAGTDMKVFYYTAYPADGTRKYSDVLGLPDIWRRELKRRE